MKRIALFLLFALSLPGQQGSVVFNNFSAAVKGVTIGASHCYFWSQSPAPGQVQGACYLNGVIQHNAIDYTAPQPGVVTSWAFGATPVPTAVAISRTILLAGSDLNDLTVSGAYTDAANPGITFTVVISTMGAPDSFQWKKGTGAFSSDVAITGMPQPLSDGVTITFAATTGHTLNDSWILQTGALACPAGGNCGIITWQFSPGTATNSINYSIAGDTIPSTIAGTPVHWYVLGSPFCHCGDWGDVRAKLSQERNKRGGASPQFSKWKYYTFTPQRFGDASIHIPLLMVVAYVVLFVLAIFLKFRD